MLENLFFSAFEKICRSEVLDAGMEAQVVAGADEGVYDLPSLLERAWAKDAQGLLPECAIKAFAFAVGLRMVSSVPKLFFKVDVLGRDFGNHGFHTVNLLCLRFDLA